MDNDMIKQLDLINLENRPLYQLLIIQEIEDVKKLDNKEPILKKHKK